MNHDNYFDIVGAYLDNELEGEELKQFESSLESNPDLQKELQFQKGLVEGIKQNRVNQLKARLDQVDVSTGSTVSSTLTKTIGGVVVAGLIGFGIYYLNDSSQPESFNEVAESTQVEISPTESIIESPVEEDNSEESNPVIAEEVNEQPQAIEEISESDVDETGTMDKADNSLPEVTLPTSVDSQEESPTEMSDVELEAPEMDMNKSISSGQSNISVEFAKKKKFNFHYEFTSDRLLLYGNFDDEPYELVEVNLQDGKKLFLKYNDTYYNIEITEEITPMDEVSDPELIEKIKTVNE